MWNQEPFKTKLLSSEVDYLAPDHSEIRLLLNVNGGGLCQCLLPPKSTSLTGMHTTVEEIWYFVQGAGQVWRKQGDREEEVDVFPGVCLTIPPQTHFQFRNPGLESLCFIIVTMPPWPGEQEWVRVADHWPTE